jgi:3,5-dihydroxyphenylacetyl-CoA synthase
MTISISPSPVDLDLPGFDSTPAPAKARITGVGTAVSETAYTQQELLDLFGITDSRIRSVFRNSAIDRRRLSLPPQATDGSRVCEAQGDLLRKHQRLALDMGSRSIQACLRDAEADPADVGYLCCVTSTGFLTPGLSALLIRDMGLDPTCSRVDVVGMGCNGGLNALNGTAAWAMANPGRVAVMLCAEACSAAYVIDDTMRTAVVNSLFGDGAAAVALTAWPAGDGAGAGRGPRILTFASQLICDAIGAMRFDWDDAQGKFSFYLDPDIPYVVGAYAENVVGRLLAAAGLRQNDIAHWLVHSGGKKVIDAIRVNLGLSRHDVRHTTAVLREYGNVSSASFLFSLERLLREGVVRMGEYGVLMTMGPGSTIETALIQW